MPRVRQRIFSAGVGLLILAALGGAAMPCFGVTLEGRRIRLDVDVAACRWSARLKGAPLELRNVYFLPNDDPSGWKIEISPVRRETNELGSFKTVTLHGTKAGELDFDYRIRVDESGGDILVRLDRANNTGRTVEVGGLDYMVAPEARLGGPTSDWMTFGVGSAHNTEYRLVNVDDIKGERMYEAAHLARNRKTGAHILMGHLTVRKGHSRFVFGKTDMPAAMRMRAWCDYRVSMPAGASFEGELLLVNMGHDGLRALERLGDLIAAANDIRLKQSRPIDLEDRGLVAGIHSRFMPWFSGTNDNEADRFIKNNGLDKFYYGVLPKQPEFGRSAQWPHYYLGGVGKYAKGIGFPDECYLPRMVKWPWGEDNGGKVIDFSNPLTAKLERERVFGIFAAVPGKVHWAHLDYSDLWDKWPGQHDPYMSAAETWRAGAAPWREIHETCPRLRSRACMAKVDFSYGFIDIARTSGDADQSWSMMFRSVISSAMRFFYNGRVYWNDCDGFHVYRYQGGEFNYGQGKVSAVFHGFAGSTTYVSEKFDRPYPEDRLELLRRIAPPTMDTAYPIDLFERFPATAWNMPIERPFGKWNVLAVFNYGDVRGSAQPDPYRVTLEAAQLRLDPAKEYLVYEFWSRKLVGSFRGAFTSRPIPAVDCDVYSIVEKRNYPVLISTSRHIRQMAVDIKNTAWNAAEKKLSGVSRAVAGDPYQLRIWAPDGYRIERVDLSGGLKATTGTEGRLFTVNVTSNGSDDVAWSVHFE